MSVGRLSFLTCLLCACLVVACKPGQKDAEIVIVVDSDFAVPGELDSVEFYVKRVGAKDEDAQTLPVALGGTLGNKLPLRLGIAPDGHVTAAVDIIVTGYHGSTRSEVVRRKASVRFQPGKVLLLRMDLVRSCEQKYKACEDKNQTCDPSGCVDVDAAKPIPYDGDDNSHSPIHDAGNPDSADAGVDASVESDAGGPDHPVQLALGDHHTCVLTEHGRVFCWGMGSMGQLGDGKSDHGEKCTIEGLPADCTPTPVQVAELPKATQIAAGAYSTCAVHARRKDELGNVSCWGEAPGKNALAPLPIQFKQRRVDDALEVRVGGKHACVRRSDGLPICWGEFVDGELGNGSTDYPGDDPVLAEKLTGLATPEDIVQLSLGNHTSCALLKNGNVLCWGTNGLGQIGEPLTTKMQLTPTLADGLSQVDALAAGDEHLCALVESEGIYCLGDDTLGELGRANEGDVSCGTFASCSPAPALVVQDQAMGEYVEVTSGTKFSCGRFSDGRAACWGDNNSLQLGTRATSSGSSVPILVLGGATTIAANGAHVCAILDNDDIVCLGNNDAGQLGVSASKSQMSSTQVKTRLPL